MVTSPGPDRTDSRQAPRAGPLPGWFPTRARARHHLGAGYPSPDTAPRPPGLTSPSTHPPCRQQPHRGALTSADDASTRTGRFTTKDAATCSSNCRCSIRCQRDVVDICLLRSSGPAVRARGAAWWISRTQHVACLRVRRARPEARFCPARSLGTVSRRPVRRPGEARLPGSPSLRSHPGPRSCPGRRSSPARRSHPGPRSCPGRRSSPARRSHPGPRSCPGRRSSPARRSHPGPRSCPGRRSHLGPRSHPAPRSSPGRRSHLGPRSHPGPPSSPGRRSHPGPRSPGPLVLLGRGDGLRSCRRCGASPSGSRPRPWRAWLCWSSPGQPRPTGWPMPPTRRGRRMLTCSACRQEAPWASRSGCSPRSSARAWPSRPST